MPRPNTTSNTPPVKSLLSGEQSARFREITDTAPVTLWMADANGQCTYVNPCWIKFTGTSRGQALGVGWLHCVHPDDRQAVQEKFELARRDWAPYQATYRARRHDGVYRWVDDHGVPRFDEHDNFAGYVGSTIDITERREAEEAMREYRRLLEHANQAGRIACWWSDPDRGGRLVWSEEAYRIFGIKPEDFDGRVETFFEMVHPDDRDAVSAASIAALERDTRYSIDHRVIRPDGTIAWVHEQADVIRDEAGRPVQMIGISQDITERKRMEEQLLQATKLEGVGRLAGGIAHDFNNLLTAILGFVELASAQESDAAACRGYLDGIRSAADSGAKLTSQLLAFARRQIIQPRVVSLDDLIASVERLVRRLIGPTIELEVNKTPSLWSVRIDPGQFEQVLFNLAVNARDAMPTGGKLVVETANVTFDLAAARQHGDLAAGEHVMLKVRDTGVGMDASVQGRVFEPFFSTKIGSGLGLGLATCYGIVKQNCGHIELCSRPGEGTTFRIYFPRDCRTADPATAEDASAPTVAGWETILVVEDEPAVRQVAVAALKSHGYAVLEAADAEEALRKVRQHRGAIDLLLTDVVMPGMSGRELADQLSPALQQMRVLLVSGYTEDALGANGVLRTDLPFLQKPYTPAVLARKVRDVLDA